jgi:hypothetical protein
MKRALLTSLLLGGCVIHHPGPGNPNGPDPNADLASYTTLQKQLDGNRTQFLDKSAMELAAVHNLLFWKTYPTFNPILHREDHTSQTRVDYGFSIGDTNNSNYRASQTLVLTAENTGDSVVYHAYDGSTTNRLVEDATLPAPSDGTKWYAYAVSGGNVYIVQPTGGQTDLLEWTPGSGTSPAMITTLESAGAQIGEFLDFDVDGNTMIFIESGRLWRLDIAANRATFLGNQTEIAGSVQFGPDGVTFEDSTGLKYYSYSGGSLRDLSAEIQAASYKVNDTYESAHYFYSASTDNNFARWNDWVVYTGNDGIFAYDLTTKAVAPILLSPLSDNMNRTDYRYPVTLDDGTLYVVGLMSTDGAVGADGPVFSVDLTRVIH